LCTLEYSSAYYSDTGICTGGSDYLLSAALSSKPDWFWHCLPFMCLTHAAIQLPKNRTPLFSLAYAAAKQGAEFHSENQQKLFKQTEPLILTI